MVTGTPQIDVRDSEEQKSTLDNTDQWSVKSEEVALSRRSYYKEAIKYIICLPKRNSFQFGQIP